MEKSLPRNKVLFIGWHSLPMNYSSIEHGFYNLIKRGSHSHRSSMQYSSGWIFVVFMIGLQTTSMETRRIFKLEFTGNFSDILEKEEWTFILPNQSLVHLSKHSEQRGLKFHHHCTPLLELKGPSHGGSPFLHSSRSCFQKHLSHNNLSCKSKANWWITRLLPASPAATMLGEVVDLLPTRTDYSEKAHSFIDSNRTELYLGDAPNPASWR